jgi:hypothetical protein
LSNELWLKLTRVTVRDSVQQKPMGISCHIMVVVGCFSGPDTSVASSDVCGPQRKHLAPSWQRPSYLEDVV